MKTRSLSRQIKMIPYFLLAVILSQVLIIGFATFYNVGKTDIIEVNVKRLKEKTYKHVDIGKNSFQTGTEGRIFWKVKNINEALLIAIANTDGVLNLYDLFYLFVLDICIFIMVFKVSEGNVFNNQIIIGLYLVGFSIMFYSFILLISYQISGWSIEKLTNGQFTSQLRNFNFIKYQMLAMLIIFTVPLFKKAMNLQQEQDLTI